MSEERKRILELLAAGKINADEAERLIAALESDSAAAPEGPGDPAPATKQPKFLHVKVESGPDSGHRHENVNIRIPILLLKAGVKLGSLMPDTAKNKITSHLAEQGLDFDLKKLDARDVDLLIRALSEAAIEIDSDDEKVRIFCA